MRDASICPDILAADPGFAEQVLAITAEVRRFLEPRWEAIHRNTRPQPKCLSQGMCVRSHKFLESVLQQNSIEAEFCFGGKRVGGGYCDGLNFFDHGWAIARNPIVGVIIDLTHDQHDGPPIIIAAADDRRFRKSAGIYAIHDYDAIPAKAWLMEWNKQGLFATMPTSARNPQPVGLRMGQQ